MAKDKDKTPQPPKVPKDRVEKGADSSPLEIRRPKK